jgi:cytochrome oxidase assembly protein ShyY1
MYRFLFSPRWLGFHLLVIVGIVTMVNLGFWQLRRLDERKGFNAEVSERIADPPAPLDDVLTPGTDPDRVEWRSVTARGTYLPDEQFLVVNRSQDGIGGTMVATPMQLADGRVLVVERGFEPGTTAPPAAPTGTVDVVGRLRPSEERHTGQLSDPSEGELREVQRIDIARLSPQLPGPPVPMYVELTASRPAEPTPYPAPVTLPELTEGPHLSYAVQWFIFSAAVVVGWVLAVRKSLRTRRRGGPPPAAAATPEAVAAAPPSSPG